MSEQNTSGATGTPSAAEMPMVVADPLAAFERDGMVKAVAPAKVNLYLAVGEVRADGYHEVETVMHALSLHDVLHFDMLPAEGEGLEVETVCYARERLEFAEIPSESNIVTRAVKLLAHKVGRAEREKIAVRIEKHIPVQAGLGGGSSDAAAALLGAAKLWGIPSDAPEILEAARELGMDVAFFLRGGCARFTGAGELFDQALSPMKGNCVVIKPAGGVSTREAYAMLDEAARVAAEDAARAAREAQRAEDVLLHNDFSAASEALVPEIAAVRTWLESRDDVTAHLMAGSGSAVFAACGSFEEACRIAGAARTKGWWARTTAFSSVRAAVVPK